MNNKISLLIFAFWLGFCFAIYAQEQITLDKIFEQRYFSENDIENITPTKDGAHYTILSEYKSIEKYAWKTGEKVGTLMDLQDTEKDSILYILDYQINSDESMILFSTAVEFFFCLFKFILLIFFIIFF